MNSPLLLSLTTELYREVLAQDCHPCDRVIKNYFQKKHFLGKRDRQAISKIFWHAIRHKSRFEWEVCRNVSTSLSPTISVETLIVRAYRDLYPSIALPLFKKKDEIFHAWERTNTPSLYKEMPPHIRFSLPEWLWLHLSETMDNTTLINLAQTLLKPAGLHLRVNTLKTSRSALKQTYPDFAFQPGKILPEALRMVKNIDITHHPIYRQGLVDIQDEGSQLIARAVNPTVHDVIIDACAGAGGKSLHLAALTHNKATLIATDKYPERLIELMQRSRRADAHILVMDQKEIFKTRRAQADILLLDMPCTGSGTFRRRPDLKWNLSPERLNTFTSLQKKILTENIPLLKHGGRLVYATCSILPNENEAQIDYLLKTWPHLKPLSVSHILKTQNIPILSQETPWFRLLPQDFDTDGYFIGVFQADT
ncbi:MAG: RsmB/NOP family class I SAM-dependent RNA methyltransferase [Candidatus Marinimicrobia bacterium]|nr:RsmB/NOP family class I SAM-dependent RNA methyltransferase [Candidatus Neomarinimicrobiota bacterium]MDD5582867.1 RsmB/NOP family class I SAM-dependent RNA methyltransferase [Candidatus Neomarinimicrobiota bacterium]